MDPPLGAWTGKVSCWWEHVEEDLLSGAFAPWLRSPYYIGEIDGEVAGYMTCLIPARNPEVGLVEFVSTAEEHRRKGVGTALLRQLIARFEANGGLALYLCTTNPGAGRLYESCGFDYYVGDGMRYLAAAAGDFEAGYLAGPGRPRSARRTGGTCRAPRCCSATRSLPGRSRSTSPTASAEPVSKVTSRG